VHYYDGGQFADKPTRGQSTHRLVYSRIGQLAFSTYSKIPERIQHIYTVLVHET